jgi:hypothetical protein
VTAYAGRAELLDYSSAKGAIVSFTRSLALSLAEKGIRVNAVAPGPVWTPLTVSSWSEQEVQTFGTYPSSPPMGRAAQPFEIAASYPLPGQRRFQIYDRPGPAPERRHDGPRPERGAKAYVKGKSSAFAGVSVRGAKIFRRRPPCRRSHIRAAGRQVQSSSKTASSGGRK